MFPYYVFYLTFIRGGELRSPKTSYNNRLRLMSNEKKRVLFIPRIHLS